MQEHLYQLSSNLMIQGHLGSFEMLSDLLINSRGVSPSIKSRGHSQQPTAFLQATTLEEGVSQLHGSRA